MEHRERAPLVVGVLEAADRKHGGPEQLAELRLGQARFSPQRFTFRACFARPGCHGQPVTGWLARFGLSDWA
jgi:hypothetical protein